METENPYQTPGVSDAEVLGVVRPVQFDLLAIASWPFLFAMNTFAPFMFGWQLTRDGGRVGLALALGLMLVAGWILCILRSSLARRLIAGSILVGLSQIFPILHVCLGVFALSVVSHLGISNGASGAKNLEFFVVTLIVGGGLLLGSAGIGALMGLVIHTRPTGPQTTVPATDTNPQLK